MSETGELVEVPRDRWGRPLIPAPDTGRVEPYTRASTLSKVIENSAGLVDWKVGMVIQGLRKRPDLLEAKAELKEIAEGAMTIAGAHDAAEAGTLLHALTEEVDRGSTIEDTTNDDRMRDRLLAYREVTQPLQVLGIELFVANREVMAAGTFDRVVRYNGKNYIADIKTGKDAPRYSHGAAIQMSVYAGATRWDPVRGWLANMYEHVEQDRAILIHLPITGDPRCTLHWVDIAAGHRMARICAAVRDWRSSSPSARFNG